VTTLRQKKQALRASSAATRTAGRQHRDAAPASPSRPPPPVLVDHVDLRTLFGIKYSRVHLWRLVRAKKFPAPVSLHDTGNRKCWRSADVVRYLAALPYAESPEAPE